MKENHYIDYFFDTTTKEISEDYLILVTYDITDNKKRLKFSRFLENYGKRVQKSCFEGFLDNRKLEKLMSKISSYIDSQTDSVRVYKINGSGQVFCYGTAKESDPEEVIII